MKKLLAMVLALVMTLSLAVSANAFKDDKSISDDYAEAVAVLNGMGVFKGYEDGSFQPKGNITRAEVSAIVYRVYTQDVKDAKASMYATYNKFSDMAGAGWAQGYIGYCANAELVKGYPDGTFKPSGKVTGYEVLAMILRAVGYDKNGEFSGADWALHVAQTAQQAGVLKNVKGVDLNAPASRELVAELLFRAIAEASTVTYTPAFGYVTDKVLNNAAPTLGYKNFKLEGKADADVFGRPATKWIYNVGDKSTLVVAKADASYTTKVSECDIAKDLGIAKTAKVEKVYVDGAVDAAGITSISALKTTSIVGDQGTVTEVFAMANGTYRIVEINTYLAKVTKVNAAYTDKNGHTVDATVNLSAWMTEANHEQTTAFVGVKAEGYVVDDYVLVTVSNPGTYAANVESIEKATVAGSGAYKSYTVAAATSTDADTITLGETKYNEAAKFFHGNKPANFGGSYDALADAYGNVIGLVSSAKNYLVIEAARWIGDGSTATGGKAVADVVLADGTRTPGVTIASVGTKAANGDSYMAAEPLKGSFDTTYTTNEKYYNHIIAYSVNADGTYALDVTVDGANSYAWAGTDMAEKNVTITKGSTIMGNTTSAVGINDATVFLVKDLKTGVYTAYTGKQNVPSMTEATVCYITSGNYATLVAVTDYKLASNTFNAYVDANAMYTGRYNELGYQFAIYPEGTNDVKYVYSAQPYLTLTWADGTTTANRDGIYSFTVDSKDVVVSAKAVLATATSSVIGGDVDVNGYVGGSYKWDRNYVQANTGNTMYCDRTPNASKENTYWVDEATYIEVSYDSAYNMTGIKKVGGYQDIDWTAKPQVLVGYKMVGDVKQAQYVYVINVAAGAAADITSTPAVFADGIVKGQRILSTVFTVKGEDSLHNAVNVPVSNVAWSRVVDGKAEAVTNPLDEFASNVKYVATFTVTAPYGVKLAGVTSDWRDAQATLNGTTVTYEFSCNWN